MRWMLATVAVIGLAGCATYSDLRQRPADFVATTSKAPGAYLQCVLPKWVDFYAGSHIMSDGESSVLVSPVGGGSPDIMAMTLSASPSDGGTTRVEMRHMPSLSDFGNQWQQAKSCL